VSGDRRRRGGSRDERLAAYAEEPIERPDGAELRRQGDGPAGAERMRRRRAGGGVQSRQLGQRHLHDPSPGDPVDAVHHDGAAARLREQVLRAELADLLDHRASPGRGGETADGEQGGCVVSQVDRPAGEDPNEAAHELRSTRSVRKWVAHEMQGS